MMNNNDRKRKDFPEDDDQLITKRVKQKISSVIAKVSNDTSITSADDAVSRVIPIGEPKLKSFVSKIEKPIVSEILKTDDILQRNKRMFAGIMGHLGRAKDRILMDTSTIEKQNTIKAAISQKQVDDARKAAERRRMIRDREIKLV